MVPDKKTKIRNNSIMDVPKVSGFTGSSQHEQTVLLLKSPLKVSIKIKICEIDGFKQFLDFSRMIVSNE